MITDLLLGFVAGIVFAAAFLIYGGKAWAKYELKRMEKYEKK